jgi:hypothetical protein
MLADVADIRDIRQCRGMSWINTVGFAGGCRAEVQVLERVPATRLQISAGRTSFV